ncbi:alkaline phosphatase family protein [Flavilitoribacter nigricans]|uniref:Alkaline phosphatase family protein n=1 Tax=Flavilitoribacter nigricans (strain ATCC 23147 / DSM 23189 / NBRC 102662 / NCIMB 1420 / SS-2) TaxID=1122177 RepID=A0A2D0N3C7_FLAN2|nr:nucleotide pyrophosphatase/phosphodiesterase family protein [Flavilitoribacter nigricans]PHN02263.1 alkaline phosphatase family protein [Flavilitoribacter nigricans DSM 23189 = NBRC 102662]
MPTANKTVVLNIVGLTSRLIGERTPFLRNWVQQKQLRTIDPVIPAVTCTAQSTYLTGKYPGEHGIVANGWYFEEEAEVKLWRQSNRLVQSEKIWEAMRRKNPEFTCANLFWWYNMYSTVDFSVTPRPMYPSDGRKIPDVYTFPSELRDELQEELGQFPLFKFWGPATSIEVSQWIAHSAMRVEEKHDPTLTLIYLPHLDYNAQRHGPDHPSVDQDLREIDAVSKELIEFYEARGAEVIVLSEYGITAVDQPVHINRVLREAGHIAVREELGLEVFDAGASSAFAMADHQIAHVYVKDKADLPRVRALLETVPGIGKILDEAGKAEHHLDHPRAGDLVLLAKPRAWFTYYYWLDDRKAPDYSRTVDIHRKPGYDPVEMHFNPALRFPKAYAAGKVILRKLGFRALMDVIPLDADLIKGSHGLRPADRLDWPVLVASSGSGPEGDSLAAHQVYEVIATHLFSEATQ